MQLAAGSEISWMADTDIIYRVDNQVHLAPKQYVTAVPEYSKKTFGLGLRGTIPPPNLVVLSKQ
ncbi:hypothetical protein O9G_003018 [Rozella allomycis CSF55]|uniref:Uncharacterized protein n=1 Tax=Rozella allomycis (strain CSF55) TaxID=988480 RepID=A0A075AVK8_ROZAC|nr:hypothetical protein O9G_003018 [Rozella allomycis CSF55]|eukprot:EPZ34298.1 hypothetical protein O9G_003018 [Rozella allomycis CSF55]